ncbi:MAG: aldo/keto reductase [Lachnospiraceae bacterium]|nr:aldo/keto reductase [Lachnospiraceae bacterium]
MERKNYRNLQLSRLGMGNMRLPVHADQEGTPIDYEKAEEIIDYAMAHGVNYYDTAYVYHHGESEVFLGNVMKKYPRDSYCLATKFHIGANPDYKAVFEEQLKRLQTDYIDFYLLHAIQPNNYQSYIDSGCIAYFTELKKEGKIRNLGFSFHATPEILDTFLELTDWDFVQIQCNYYDWCYSDTKTEYEKIAAKGLPIIVMEPVRGGRLADVGPDANALLQEAHPDWSAASWALHFVKSLPQVQVVLSGMSTLDQIVDNVNTFSDGIALSEEETKTVYKAAALYRKYLSVPCTACRYCCDDCPMRIEIPKFIAIYNEMKLEGRGGIKQKLEKAESAGKPADCIGCGCCTGHCPQSIDVPKIMKELAEL